jgi:hypothetical protein
MLPSNAAMEIPYLVTPEENKEFTNCPVWPVGYECFSTAANVSKLHEEDIPFVTRKQATKPFPCSGSHRYTDEIPPS